VKIINLEDKCKEELSENENDIRVSHSDLKQVRKRNKQPETGRHATSNQPNMKAQEPKSQRNDCSFNTKTTK
jgi:hypothetical protein